MRLIYVDEAGTSNPGHEPFLVVAAVVVHADRQAKHLENELRRIREKHCPDAPSNMLFHATTLYSGASGSHYFNRESWPKEKRWAILDDLVAIPRTYDLPIMHGAVDRTDPAQLRYVDLSKVPARKRLEVHHAVAFVTCSITVDLWMRQHASSREVAVIIAEDHPDVKESLRQVQAFGRNPGESPNLVPGWQKYFPFRKIIDTVHYARKVDSALLQLADVCAFVIKRQLMSQKAGLPEGDRFYAPLSGQHFQPGLRALKPHNTAD